MRDTERGRHRQKERQALHGDPDMLLNPRILGSRPESKADAQSLNHLGAPKAPFILKGMNRNRHISTDSRKHTFRQIVIFGLDG